MAPQHRRSSSATLFGRMTQWTTIFPISMVAQAGEEILRQVEAEYPALLFKQQLTTYVEKIYGIISDNLRKENFPSWIMSSGMVQTFTTDSERRVRLTVSARRRGGRHATCSEQQTVEEPYKEVAELHLDVQDIGADDAEISSNGKKMKEVVL